MERSLSDGRAKGQKSATESIEEKEMAALGEI